MTIPFLSYFKKGKGNAAVKEKPAAPAKPTVPPLEKPSSERFSKTVMPNATRTLPPQDPFELFRRLWGPLGVPVPGMAMPTLDPREIDKRIADLRSIEGWLNMNLNMVRFSIQGLELQRATLNAMRAATESPKKPG